MELKTYGEVKKHLLMVMDYANDEPTKGNSGISKGKYWNMIMGVCINAHENEECGSTTANAVLREFPEHLRFDYTYE